METSIREFEHLDFQALSTENLYEIEGGSFWEDVAWVVGYGLHKGYDFLRNLDAGTALASPVGAGSKGAAGK